MKDRLRLCSSYENRLIECADFQERASKQHLSQQAMHNILATNPRNFESSTILGSRPKTQDKATIMWLVLPYIPCMQKAGVASQLHRFFNSSWAQIQLHLAFGAPVKVRISWSNCMTNVSGYLVSKPLVTPEGVQGDGRWAVVT